MHLSRQRDRGKRQRREHESPALECKQHRRQEKRDLAEQVARALLDAVRREREQHASEQRRRARQPERAQPPAGEAAGGEEGEQKHEVVGPGGPERALDAARTACANSQPWRFGRTSDSVWNEYGSIQGLRAVLELVSGQPVVPDELEVVPRRLLAVPGSGAGEVVAVHVA